MAPDNRPSGSLHAMRRVVVCGSMTFYGIMIRLREQLVAEGVEALLPNAETHFLESTSQDQFETIRHAFSRNHIRRIRNPLTYGILVANFDKHGIRDYIGPSTFAEIAIAAVHGKKVFVFNEFPTVYEDELSLWRAEALHGRLERLIDLYRQACLRPIRQFNMFAA